VKTIREKEQARADRLKAIQAEEDSHKL